MIKFQLVQLPNVSMKEAYVKNALTRGIEEAACFELNNYRKNIQTAVEEKFKSDARDYMRIYNPVSNPLPSPILTDTSMDDGKSARTDIEIDVDINPIDAYYQDVAFFCLRRRSPLRHWAIRITLWPNFERLTMFIILVNCVTLGLYDPYDEKCLSSKCQVLEHLETSIYAYFVLEMLIKMLAFGIFGDKGYLAESWNKLDLFIVAAGTFELAYGDGEFLSSVRAVRVLRPLRAINRVPSIRILVTLLLDTLPMLGNVFILCVLILMVFSIIGVQLWQGVLRGRCTLDLPYNASTYVKNNNLNLSTYYVEEGADEWSLICSSPGNNGQVSCGSAFIPPYTIDDGHDCSLDFNTFINISSNFTSRIHSNTTGCVNWNQYYTKCMPHNSNPHFGAISFDNTGIAFIAIFQSITLEGWADIMYYLQDAYSNWVWVYFVTLIVLGSYFLTNLCLVVVATQFSETRQRESALMEIARKKARSTSSTIFTPSDGENKGCYNQILSMLHHYIMRASRKVKRRMFGTDEKRISRKSRRKRGDGDGGSVQIHHHHHHHIHHHHLHLCPNSKNVDTPVNNNDQTTDLAAPERKAIMPAAPAIRIDDVCDKEVLQPLPNIPINTTALIIPDTTVVICHSSTLPNSLKTESPLTTVALFPSLSKLHRSSHESVHQPTNLNLGASYCSVGDVNSCETELSKEELNRCERAVCCESDDYSDDEEEEVHEPSCQRRRNIVRIYCEKNCFKVFIMAAIFFNTVTMAMEHYKQPEKMTMALDVFNTIFTTIFTIEMFMKLTGYGFYGYIKDAFNVFDGAIVIISIVELAGSNQGGVSVLRTFRLMRIFKLVRFLPTLQKQIQVMLETLDSVMTFLGLLTIFIFTSSILGMHLFGGKIKEVDGNEPVRHNFDNLMWSLITVFQVLTQEDWNQVLYDAMRSTTKWASVYFILLMIIGNYILFNLLVAILVEGFSTETEGILSSPLKSPLILSRIVSPNSFKDQDDVDEITRNEKEKETSHMSTKVQAQSLPNISQNGYIENNNENSMDTLDPFQNTQQKYAVISASESAINRQVKFSDTEEEKVLEEKEEDPEKNPEKAEEKQPPACCGFCYKRRDWTLYLVSPENKYRQRIQSLVANAWFDNVVLFFILLNCIIMALERPSIEPNSTERKIIDYSNHVFTGVFFIEMCIKIFAWGFYFGEDTTYLKNNWNRIDFVLVIISVVDLFVTYIVHSKSGVLGMLKVFRAFRTLRPLRVISRAPGLKIVVETLIASLAPIGNLVVVALVFFTIFGILGVQLFKGSFHFCSDEHMKNGTAIMDKTQCIQNGSSWTNKKYNFDNLLQALFALFVFATKDGWVSLMYDGIDAVGIDKQPKKNHNPWAFLYFVSFLLIAGFVVINMVVGVIIDNFQKCRVMVEEEMNEAQLEEFHHHNDSSADIPRDLDQYSKARRVVYDLVSHYKFDLAIAVVIGLNVVFMALEFYQMPQKLIFFLRIMNYIFTGIFILEAILKIYGLGPRLFFAQRWNQLDIVIVFLSIIGIVFEELNSSLPINPTIIRIMRVLRIARVLKILKAADGIQRLLNCVSQSLPQVGNLSMLFLLIFFIFSALGIELFGGLDCKNNECAGLSRHAHFDDFTYALLTLFRISTGDNWSGLLKDCINEDLCPEGCPIMPYVAPIYFAVFVLASQFVLVNVVVAVLMKQLEDAKDTLILSPPPRSASRNTCQDKGENNDNHGGEGNRLSVGETEPLFASSQHDVTSENLSMIANTGEEDGNENYMEMVERKPKRQSHYDNLSVTEFTLAQTPEHTSVLINVLLNNSLNAADEANNADMEGYISDNNKSRTSSRDSLNITNDSLKSKDENVAELSMEQEGSKKEHNVDIPLNKSINNDVKDVKCSDEGNLPFERDNDSQHVVEANDDADDETPLLRDNEAKTCVDKQSKNEAQFCANIQPRSMSETCDPDRTTVV